MIKEVRCIVHCRMPHGRGKWKADGLGPLDDDKLINLQCVKLGSMKAGNT